MGLDIDLIKFNKEFFDSKTNEYGYVESINVNSNDYKKIYYWRKKYIILYLLSDGDIYKGQLSYQPLTKEDLENILVKVRETDWSDPKSTEQGTLYDPNLISDFEKLLVTTLSETNFETEQIAYTWIP